MMRSASDHHNRSSKLPETMTSTTRVQQSFCSTTGTRGVQEQQQQQQKHEYYYPTGSSVVAAAAAVVHSRNIDRRTTRIRRFQVGWLTAAIVVGIVAVAAVGKAPVVVVTAFSTTSTKLTTATTGRAVSQAVSFTNEKHRIIQEVSSARATPLSSLTALPRTKSSFPAAATTTTTTTKRRTVLAAATQQPSSSSSTNPAAASSTKAVCKLVQQTMILDGAEWISVRTKLLMMQQQSKPQPWSNTQFGVYTGITGSINGRRVVGMMMKQQTPAVADDTDTKKKDTTTTLDQDSSIQLYSESIAYIPDKISESDALWTMLQSLSMIHCVRPTLYNVGGNQGSMEFISTGHIVIIGSNDCAVTAARILSQLSSQYKITIVAADRPNTLPINVKYLPITTTTTTSNNNDDEDDDDDDMQGFSTVLGKYDAVLDTLGNEHNENGGDSSLSTVIKLLAEKHGCSTYVSTQTKSQDVIVQNGLLFGPAKTKEHISQCQSRAIKATAAYFPSPMGLGNTVQAMLDKGMTLPPPKEYSSTKESIYVRGWSLKDFWEYTTWPRDAVSNVRFGFPSLDKNMYDYDDDDDDDDNDDGTMVSAPPFRASRSNSMFGSGLSNQDEEEEDATSNPYVVPISDVKGLQQIVQDKTTCLLFLSAPFCRTCRYLRPQYQRMARQYMETTSASSASAAEAQSAAVSEQDADDEASTPSSSSSSYNLKFVKAEASGATGKELGRALGVDSVPSFLLFKNGRRYGQPLSISRLPSKKLELALSYMQQDKAWDTKLFNTDGKDDATGSTPGSSNQRIKLF